MTNRILAILGLYCALFVSPPAQAAAESIQGVIAIRGDQAYIRLRQMREPLPLHGKTQDLVVNLKKMRDGDFVVGRGEILTDRNIVSLHSIDTVGLRQILGTWRASNQNVFEFRDFNHVILYDRISESATLRPGPVRQMSYTLAPSTGENWSIFMADNKGIHIGELRFGPRLMRMTLYDSDTGRVSHQLDLAPIRR